MKKPSVRKMFRKKKIREHKVANKELRKFRKLEFLQWKPTTVNGQKVEN